MPDHPITRSQIPQYYTSLLARYGPQNWWPARSRFEVIVGAYLTQNTNWSNVEKAMANLRSARLLSVSAMRKAPIANLQALVRPSGYFRQKARNLKTFIAFLDRQYSGS
ncbi:MAG TPA: endonuclease III domain-containing protein, partial [Alphaproteobacteria bacterium]|nr:endonuclease III domain-containing protein [Alphaproteobacteria bacterium]